ncbi:Gfo/Idh/MocA family protein [Aquibacillus rhizosphaerae]|uniref:Gfo/Idh/MocA family oxidoreductase n=1 Tax=Aquibacillus rhizosphaerae TaxID=3051431 RepID=A0ABT7L9T4_9BACI|nr:Gfo/Idh/MocA family oxidoreductase [Aquibacillus sp. LR5S19]MDL4842618.1 Gfo/Idh/MocA family oxidoreductase [Aquibacillus sp. LR5S19]
MKNKVSIVLVGISGYGSVYVRNSLDESEIAYIVGVVDINPKHSNYYEQLLEKNIPIYDTLEAFYQNYNADLAIISTPIHLHKQQSCHAMLNGSNVLCEKPATGNPKEVGEMMKVRDQTGKFLAIGYNWSFTESVQQLKQDVLDGLFGKPKRMKSIVLWPRNEEYYARTGWAGKKYSSNNEMIFDSIANNATAHFLHHMFYLLGSSIDSSCLLKDVTAELYRTNDIETFDTCAIKMNTTEDVEIYYYASHTVLENKSPQYEIEFENATISYNPNNNHNEIVASFTNGDKKVYKDPQQNTLAKLNVCIDAVANQHKDILCGVEAASTHVSCIQAIHESLENATVFSEVLVNYEEAEKLWWVDGLEQQLQACYTKWRLPSDEGIEWAERGKTVRLLES